jgi:hypothetical protein
MEVEPKATTVSPELVQAVRVNAVSAAAHRESFFIERSAFHMTFSQYAPFYQKKPSAEAEGF